jgi:hypothetical protein
LFEKLNTVNLDFSLRGVDDLAAIEESQHSGFMGFLRRQNTISSEKASDLKDAHLVRLLLAPRGIWKIRSIVTHLQEALPKKEKAGGPRPADIKKQRMSAKLSAHYEKLAKVFHQFDKDGSGELDHEEVLELIEDIYGEQMTKRELHRAAKQLVQALDHDKSDGIGLHELQSFFSGKYLYAGSATEGALCLKLGEFGRTVREYFDPLATFTEEVACGTELKANADMKLMQLRWVRTVQNYKEAKRLWHECLVPYAPELANKTAQETKWLLQPSINAYDFWNSPLGHSVQESTALGNDIGNLPFV